MYDGPVSGPKVRMIGEPWKPKGGCSVLIEERTIAEDERYSVDTAGRVFSQQRPGVLYRKQLRPSPQYRGHMAVCLGRGKTRFIHRLVLEAFVGPCPAGLKGCHKDGDPADNRLDNLRWGTRRSNYEDSVRHGTAYLVRGSHVGEDNHVAVLNEPLVRAIMQVRLETGLGAKGIARLLGLDERLRGAIDGVIRGQSWNHVTGLPPYRPRSSVPGRRRTSDNLFLARSP
jgi:hypothetical protein